MIDTIIRLLANSLILVACCTITVAAADWPDGARTAVALSFDLDGETLWWDEPGSMKGQPGPVSQGAFGPGEALPRILDVLARHNVRATFFVPSWVAEKHPDAIARIVAGGHEVGAHGVVHVSPNTLDREEELRRLRESVDVLTRLSGNRPVGYRAPSWALSDVTLELVAAEGFRYSSNLMDSELPYLHADIPGLVELPVSWVLDDAPHFWFDETSWNKTIRTAAEVGALWREEFEAAYANGGYFGLTMHPQIIGRQARLRMFDELLGWMRGHDGVWFATGRAGQDKPAVTFRASQPAAECLRSMRIAAAGESAYSLTDEAGVGTQAPQCVSHAGAVPLDCLADHAGGGGHHRTGRPA
jgi:peptidoglycan/xylan/chitin deacetylase (PgdA/CDA1 family)